MKSASQDCRTPASSFPLRFGVLKETDRLNKKNQENQVAFSDWQAQRDGDDDRLMKEVRLILLSDGSQ